MASYNDVLGALREYRNELATQTLTEIEDSLSSPGAMRSFSARGASAAFSTPLTNIHATGVGIRRKGGKPQPEDFVIKVYVFDKVEMGNTVPALTKNFQGIGVDVETLPIQKALLKQTPPKKGAPRKGSRQTVPPEHRQKHRPIMGGVTIAPLNESYVGTLGCFLQRTTNGISQVFALSNNHVLADTNRLSIGTPIVQPGPEVEPTIPGDVFAALTQFVPLLFPENRSEPVTNALDAAIAMVANEKLIQKGKQFGIARYEPKIGAAVPGMRVIKSGRTTGVTRGIVDATRVHNVLVDYGTRHAPRIATFNDTIQIVGDNGKPFSMPGDSGSVILEEATGQPVALLFAGDGHFTTACDFGSVCRQFEAFPV